MHKENLIDWRHIKNMLGSSGSQGSAGRKFRWSLDVGQPAAGFVGFVQLSDQKFVLSHERPRRKGRSSQNQEELLKGGYKLTMKIWNSIKLFPRTM